MKFALIIFCNFISFKKGINANLYYMQKSRVREKYFYTTIESMTVQSLKFERKYFNKFIAIHKVK